MTLEEALLDTLPQTQCRQCGFDGCAQYAKALAQAAAPANRCAPGGQAGVDKLSHLLGIASVPLDPEYGKELPFAVASIDAKRCIGCALCAVACPVEVISGVAKHLFAVIENQCTGCGLCVCACPVNAVEMHEVNRAWTHDDAVKAKIAYEKALERRAKVKEDRLKAIERQAQAKNDFLAAVLMKAKEGQS